MSYHLVSRALDSLEGLKAHGGIKRYAYAQIDKNYFKTIVELIKDKLSEDQLKRINITNQNEIYDLEDQIFLRYVDNRYWAYPYKSKTLENVEQFLQKYEFLLDSQWDSSKVREIFMKALMNCASAGSGVFFAAQDFHFIEFPIFYASYIETHPIIKIKLFKLWESFRKDYLKICELIGSRYPTIPKIEVHCDWSAKKVNGWESCSLEKQILISYSYAIRKLLKKKKINSKEFGEEFVKKCKWYLESLTQCNPIYVNKYKEEIFRELSNSLGMDVDRSYFVYLSFLKNPPGDQYKQKHDLSEFIANLFPEEKLKLFELRQSDGNIWSFEEQIKDRYYSKYPSFVSIQEIEENLKKKVEEYEPLLNENTVEIIRDAMFDEIERECFVSYNTYLWNQEMEKNLMENNYKCSRKITEAIDLLISMIPIASIEQLSININNRIFSLKEQLMCRWRKAWFGCSLKNFQEYLESLYIHTQYAFAYWKEKVSRIDLQAFLEEIDMFFLYPNKWRIVKKLLSRLDNGRVIGKKNAKRLKMSRFGMVFKFYNKTWNFYTIARWLLIFVSSYSILSVLTYPLWKSKKQ